MAMDPKVQILLDDPELAQVCTWFEDPDEWDGFLQVCLEMTSSDPDTGERLAETVVRLAPTRCQRVRGCGLLARIHGTLGNLDQADEDIKLAFFLAQGCPECPPDLHRRRVYIRRRRDDLPGALEDADKAVNHYRKPGNSRPDLRHNLQGNGLADSYTARGFIYLEMDRPELAVADNREALAVLDPVVSPRLYRLVLANLALCLFLTGKRSDLVLAETYICKARQLFKGVSRRSQERAKLDWITAMIRHHLNQGRPCRRRKMIQRAIDTFLDLGMELEAIAAVSDLACMLWHCDEYRQRIREVLSALRGRLRIEALTPGVVEALRELGPQIEAAGFDAHLNLRAAIEKLRTACSEADETGTRVLACLLTWPESSGSALRGAGVALKLESAEPEAA